MIESETQQSFPAEFYSDPFGLNRYVVQEKALLSWMSPSKLEKDWRRKDLKFLIVTLALVCMILLLFGEFFFTLVIIIGTAVMLLLATTKATQLEVNITTIGVKVEDKYFYWDQLTQFWFEDKDDIFFVYFRDVIPRVHNWRLIARIEEKEKIRTEIGKYLLYKVPYQTSPQKFLRKMVAALPFDVDVYLWQ